MNHAVVSMLKEGNRKLRVHLIGVAGSGMSGLAQLLMELGHEVSGSDRVTTRETERLQKNGLRFFCPQSEQEVDGADVVIYSSAVKQGNPAYDAAIRGGIPLVRRAEALAAVMSRKHGVVVAGTHGKTTTSSMTAHVLRVGGKNPSHYVGAEIPILGTNAQWNNEGELFVAEGDESDGTLVHFEPRHAIILNVEAEHLDFYKSLDEIKAVFRQLLAKTNGYHVYCGEDEVASELCSINGNGVSYGWGRNHDFSAELLELRPAQSVFEVYHRGDSLGQVTLGIPGRHNVLNALAATGLAYSLGVEFEKIKMALESFRGAKRRFETKFAGKHYHIVDDYGHHPTEIKATLATAKALNPQRIFCLFQPHRYSRTQLLRKEFGEAFDDVDVLCVTDVYAASEQPIPGISGETIIEEVKAHHSSVKCFSTPRLPQARDVVGNKLQPGDLLITLGAGNVHEVGTSLARDLKVAEQLQEIFQNEGGGMVKLYEPLSNHTTMRIGGPAQYWLEPHTIRGFVKVVNFLRSEQIPIRVIGRGSNLLVRDGGIRGAVIHLSRGEFDTVEVRREQIYAAAGVRLKKLASAARNGGLTGFEWMEGIPGNVGGALRMNAGAMGSQMFDQVVSVQLLDANGQLSEKSIEEIEHHYRNVPELEHHYAVSVVLQGKPGRLDEIDEKLHASQRKRRESQPIGASAGCIFKNPQGESAGKLVDELGLKLKACGAAAVSQEHGNFILNKGGAKAQEVLDLIQEIKAIALEQRGIVLENEVQVIGEEEPLPLS